MGLFDKKYCDFCGEKIGILGIRKLEDGSMCRKCASKLSPWFSERRHSTKADIAAQLDYREENRAAAARFNATRSIGGGIKLMIDDAAHKFAVSASTDVAGTNADVLDFSQMRGCDLDIKESRSEIRHTDSQGRSVSYNPPRYEYSYNFFVTLYVDHPYFDEIKYSLSNGYVKTGETPMNASYGGVWHVSRVGSGSLFRNRYYDYMDMGGEIREAVDYMRREGSAGNEQRVRSMPQEAPQYSAPVQSPTPVICPWCGKKLSTDFEHSTRGEISYE